MLKLQSASSTALVVALRINCNMMFNSIGVERSGFAPPQLLSSGAIIGLALAGVFICLIIVDLLLFCWRRQGVIATICGKRAKNHKDDEAKLGR